MQENAKTKSSNWCQNLTSGPRSQPAIQPATTQSWHPQEPGTISYSALSLTLMCMFWRVCVCPCVCLCVRNRKKISSLIHIRVCVSWTCPFSLPLPLSRSRPCPFRVSLSLSCLSVSLSLSLYPCLPYSHLNPSALTLFPLFFFTLLHIFCKIYVILTHFFTPWHDAATAAVIKSCRSCNWFFKF